MKRTIRRRPFDLDGERKLPADLHPVLRRVYAARSVRAADELDCSARRLAPPTAMTGLDDAAGLLQRALREDWRVLIVGDFDADGATSTALAIRALAAMGAAHVDYLVPNRFDFGYGLSPALVEVAAERRPDLIVTVDNGISSLEGVAAARSRGIRVLVTDHHLPGPVLPEADVIVNPNLRGDPFPSKHLAGVGVIFYVMAALRQRLRDDGHFAAAGIPEPAMAELLDLVAVGTVADVVTLDHNNRILVEQGLRRIRAGRACPGILALLEVSGREPAWAVASDLGFAVGPRLNAAGRLEDMSIGIECLLAASGADARSTAETLDRLNRQRRDIETQMREEALAALERAEAVLEGEELPRGLCLYDAGWHPGVVGILAARVKERYHRPVVAFAPEDGGRLKGSARSVPGVHVRDALEAVNSRFPDLIEKFGGHAMAAGLTLTANALEPFRTAFDRVVAEMTGDRKPEGVLLSDGELAAGEISLWMAELLQSAGPWGQGFPEPLFDGVFGVVDCRIVGERHLKMRLRHPSGDGAIDAIAFNQGEHRYAVGQGAVRMAYRLDVNEYRGRRSAQLVVEYLEPAEP